MIRRVDCPATVILGRDELDVHVFGECWRAPDSRVEAHITCVLLDERDVTTEMLKHESVGAALRMRLACEFIAKPIRETPDESAAWSGGPNDAA